MKLSEELKHWRIERPDEWKMDEFIEKAEALEAQLDWLDCLEAAGVDNWEGVDYARELLEDGDAL